MGYVIKIGKRYVQLIAWEEKKVKYVLEPSATHFQFKDTAKAVIKKRNLVNARVIKIYKDGNEETVC